MFSLLSMAARNLLRNKRRTTITVLGIAMGLSLIQMTYNLNFGNYTKLLDSGIRGTAGHVVLQHPQWQEEREVEQVVENSLALAEALRADNPQALIARRIFAGGLLTSPTNTIPTGILGIDPEIERQLSSTAEKMVEGAWLEPGDAKGILIGDTLAKRLGVGLKGRVVVMAPAPDDPSESVSQLFRVRGIYHSGVATLDNFTGITTVEGAQPLLRGTDSAHQIAVVFDDDTQTAAAFAKAEGMDRGGAAALSWKEAVPDLRNFIQADTQTNDTFFFVIGFIVVLGVVNTMLMSVLERVREFGVMLAVGMRPGRLAMLVLTEGVLLGAAAALLGTLLGAAFTYPLATTGLDFSAAYGETIETAGVAMDTLLIAKYAPTRMAAYAVSAIFMTVLASAWPAWRVTRMRPIQAIQHL